MALESKIVLPVINITIIYTNILISIMIITTTTTIIIIIIIIIISTNFNLQSKIIAYLLRRHRKEIKKIEKNHLKFYK